MTGSVFIIGAGPGIGAAVARRFARENRPIALLARRHETLEAVRSSVLSQVAIATVAADCSDERSLRRGLDTAVAEVGPPEVVIYNAAVIRPDRIGELTMSRILKTWAVDVGGAAIAGSHLIPTMVDNGGGSFLITGGMPTPKFDYVTLSLGKLGVRTLARILDAEFATQGLHVASVTISDVVAPGGRYDPDIIAEHYWSLHVQPAESWDLEVVI
ncbi:SDR family NAD(P)-dependent oxidoreductase [Gryllotalpicola protaetiae]|uniref:SDR family NAD(P)-dependent oxidoreductase n=1 Tax=Gryllotalpicola protaetiae TaxID=2419771 RepID=A0A387BL51_9MICO|nr:SDR family NAD(P)-dependent oxidoreductase [Gryllotalpicola protaetiae]AYG04603.1 SDR family NAD(P)-dependent oxidoreductase [Gryllotalpicola protaetiae]